MTDLAVSLGIPGDNASAAFAVLAPENGSSGWRLAAACRGLDDAPFFTGRPERALAVCATCGVRQACLDDVLADDARIGAAGVRGGLTARQRINLARSRHTNRDRRADSHERRLTAGLCRQGHLMRGTPGGKRWCPVCRAEQLDRRKATLQRVGELLAEA